MASLVMSYEQFGLNSGGMPPGLDVVLDCLRVQKDGTGRLLDRCRQDMDWRAVVWWARRHRVVPLVYKALKRFAWDHVPDTIRRTLENDYRKNSLKSLSLSAETLRLIRLFNEHGIKAIPIKGQVLTQQIYEGLDNRHAGDIDILIAPRNIEKAEDLLLQHRYHRTSPKDMFSPFKKRVSLKRTKYIIFHSPSDHIKIELHWRLLSYSLLPFTFDQIYSKGDRVTFGGTSLKVISHEDLLLYLCVHGSVHCWSRLKWLCDMALILTSRLSVDWGEVLGTAHKLGVLRPVMQSLLLTNLLFDCPLPKIPFTNAVKNPALTFLVRSAYHRIINPDVNPCAVSARFAACYYRLNLRKDMRYKIDELRNLTLCVEDWRRLPLPDILFPLYYFARPFFWAKRRLQR